MEKNYQIKLRVCIKDEKGTFKIKKDSEWYQYKNGAWKLKRRTGETEHNKSRLCILEDNCPIEKDTEKDLLLEDIIQENNKIYIQNKQGKLNNLN